MGAYEYFNPSVVVVIPNPVIRVFPNPVNNILNINKLQSNSRVSIYDVTGKLVYHNPLAKNQINVSTLTKGAYTIKIESEKEITVRKFIKQ